MLHDHSSGDPTADRRFAYAMDYKDKGDLAAAAELVEQALDRAPAWAVGWFALGDLLESTGRSDDAIIAFRRSQILDIRDVAGAGARLARLGALEADGAMTPTHVAALFDDYASRFETSLMGQLGYRGPALLRSALSSLRTPLQFGMTLDLGCGTGLAADTFQDVCTAIDGVDLSGQMLAIARSKQVYRHLEQADVATFLASQVPESADLVLAADVFVYIGSLETIFSEVARVLARGGLFAFTAQSCEGTAPFVVNHDMRYAHSATAIAEWADKAGLSVVYQDREWSRRDRGSEVPGMVVVLGRR